MQSKPVFNVAAISAAEAGDPTRIALMSMSERGELLIAACRAAAALEDSRLKMGFAPAMPAPWPDSTWKFLADKARHVRSSQFHE